MSVAGEGGSGRDHLGDAGALDTERVPLGCSGLPAHNEGSVHIESESVSPLFTALQ